MLLTQIKYFQAVVKLGSFSKAAEECHISQSAVSQQIKSLENELGTRLLLRHNRTFSLTEAGEHFYRKSLVITSDLDRLVSETKHIGGHHRTELTIGYYRGYGFTEFQNAVTEFSKLHPDVVLTAFSGNHEDLFVKIRDGQADMVFNDQRRALSDEYVNNELCEAKTYIQVATHNPISNLDTIEIKALQNTPCILVASDRQKENEANYYRDVLGFTGGFLFADNLQDARMMVASNKGVMPCEISVEQNYFDASIRQIPLLRNGKQVKRKFYAFWREDRQNEFVSEFAAILKEQFV